MAQCRRCQRILTNDEIGLYRKMIHRGATEYLCLNCLAEDFHCDPERLREKIRQFKRNGCMLFTSE